jgi:hypothetical protein
MANSVAGARRPNRLGRAPRTYDQIVADEHVAWDALTPAQQTKRLLANKAVHDAAHEAEDARSRGLHEHVQRVCLAMSELTALVASEEDKARAEVEAKIAEEQAQLATKQQREMLALLLSLLSNLPDDAFLDADDDADDELELDCAD